MSERERVAEAVAANMAAAFTRWMETQGYVNNPDVTEREVRLMPQAYAAGCQRRARLLAAPEPMSDDLARFCQQWAGELAAAQPEDDL